MSGPRLSSLAGLAWLLSTSTNRELARVNRVPCNPPAIELSVGQNTVICMKLSARAPSLFLHVCSPERDVGKVYWELNQPRFWGTHGHRKWAFFSFNTVCLNTTKFVLLPVFTLKETICPRICRNSPPKSAKRQLPVHVRRSKKKKKLPIVARNGDPWMSSLKYTFRWPRISLFYLFI